MEAVTSHVNEEYLMSIAGDGIPGSSPNMDTRPRSYSLSSSGGETTDPRRGSRGRGRGRGRGKRGDYRGRSRDQYGRSVSDFTDERRRGYHNEVRNLKARAVVSEGALRRPRDNQPRDEYPRPREGYSRPREGYSRPREEYSRPRDGYSRPRDGYSNPREEHPQTTRTSDDVASGGCASGSVTSSSGSGDMTGSDTGGEWTTVTNRKRIPANTEQTEPPLDCRETGDDRYPDGGRRGGGGRGGKGRRGYRGRGWNPRGGYRGGFRSDRGRGDTIEGGR